jgi:hypothetical protein
MALPLLSKGSCKVFWKLDEAEVRCRCCQALRWPLQRARNLAAIL